MIKHLSVFFISLFIFLAAVGCSSLPSRSEQPSVAPAPESPALAYWRNQKPYNPIIWIEVDLDNDSRLDTVLIYREAEDKCLLCAVLNTAQGFKIIESTRAPLENQLIQSKDIDKQPPMEIMVSGSKNGKYGYGIFRLENNQLIDLFADGMNECC